MRDTRATPPSITRRLNLIDCRICPKPAHTWESARSRSRHDVERGTHTRTDGRTDGADGSSRRRRTRPRETSAKEKKQKKKKREDICSTTLWTKRLGGCHAPSAYGDGPRLRFNASGPSVNDVTWAEVRHTCLPVLVASTRKSSSSSNSSNSNHRSHHDSQTVSRTSGTSYILTGRQEGLED